MKKNIERHFLGFFAVLGLSFFPALVIAQSFSPSEIISERIKTTASQAPRNNQEGDYVELYNGSLSFQITDAEIKGNNDLDFKITRTISPTSIGDLSQMRAGFGDWTLNVPRISTITADWINGTPNKEARCSVNDFGTRPPAYRVTPPSDSSGIYITSRDYWSPAKLITESDTGTLLIPSQNSLSPSNEPGVKWVTKGRSIITCLANIKNGVGEGFYAKTPDGKRYRFDWLAKNRRTPIIGSQMSPWYNLPNYEFSLYATRVEDRYGNWVEYDYQNTSSSTRDGVRLNAIRSNDGRKIQLNYNDKEQVVSVASNQSVWSYEYSSDNRLIKVIRPDNSFYKYDFSQEPLRASNAAGSAGDCSVLERPLSTKISVIHVESPSGLKTTYYLKPTRFGRSNVPRVCIAGGASTYVLNYASYALIRKVQEGPSIPLQEWTYNYESTYGWEPFIGKSVVSVRDPDGSSSIFTYGNAHEDNDGLLLTEERASAQNNLATKKLFVYGIPGGSIGVRAGISPSGLVDYKGNEIRALAEFEDSTIRPEREISVIQDGRVFKRTVTEFDAWMRPLTITQRSD